jgi:hypothetical protein
MKGCGLEPFEGAILSFSGGTEENNQYLSEDSQFPGRESNRAPPDVGSFVYWANCPAILGLEHKSLYSD